MKAEISVFKSRDICLILVALCFAVLPALGDVGGGSGTVITPYVGQRDPTVKDIKRLKEISKRNRTIHDLKLRNTNRTKYGEKVGLMYVEGERAAGKPLYQFSGITESGDKMSIDLSEVRSFTVIKIKSSFFADDQATLRIVQFPTITPEKLFKSNPTYTELDSKYKKAVTLFVPLQKDKKELALVGKFGDEDNHSILSLFRDIEANQEVELGYGNFYYEKLKIRIESIWWATRSVINDNKYPFKMYYKR